MNSKAFRIFGGTALMLSAATATLPEAVQAAPATRVRVAGTARVSVTNVPTVTLNGTPTVRLETGSTVALQPGSAVSLQPGTAVALQPGATVGLEPGAAVSLQPGGTVSLPADTQVGLTPGTTISVRDDAAREAVQMGFTLSMSAGTSVDSEFLIVPADKILVIEYLSCSVQLPTGQGLYADLQTRVDAAAALHSFVPAGTFPDGSTSIARVIISSPTRLYSDPETTVTLTVRRTATGNPVADFPCSLSGYYVDAT